MLPSRGLRPAQFAPLSSRQSTILRSKASRKFSSLPRTAGLSAPSCRASPLQSARWRTGANANPHIVLTASSVRYGSWYAPWSWGKSSTPSGETLPGAEQVPVAEFTTSPAPTVTSNTPELAPAGIDKAPVVNSTSETSSAAADTSASFKNPQTMDDLLGLEPEKDIIPQAEIDPTALIDHAGSLKELGLDFGWGMSTVFEKTIEQIYLNSGWGWAGSIMAAGVAVRCATFFFQALASDRMAGMASLKPLTEPIQKQMEAAIARGDKQQEHVYKMQLAQIMKPFVGGMASTGGFMIVQMWIGFGAFRCLRAMGTLPVPGMVQDGFLWFSDLTARDPYFFLPALTTTIFYAIFKTGGETGVTVDNGTRQKLMAGMSFFFGIITAFQPAALQLYFLVQGILGAATGWALRQNGFRRFVRIRPLPSRKSNEVYSQVIRGEIKLEDVKGADGKVRYQAPRAQTQRRKIGTLPGIKIKGEDTVPAHLKTSAPARIDTDRPDRDLDFEQGPQGTMRQKLDYYRRNYRLAYVARRVGAKLGLAMPKGTEAQQKRKQRAEQYEIERKRRFMNRK